MPEKADLATTESDYGLATLAEPAGAIVDVVLVHGFTGSREASWTHKATNNFWPQMQLPIDLPKARIFSFGYDADIVRALNTVSSNTLRDHGNTLANELGRRRMRSKSRDRPILFVAHNLGGLVVEQTLLICRGAAEEHLNVLLESTYGIVFMGTPHVGSNLARWTKVLTGLSNFVRKSNTEIIGVLKPGSEVLANLQQEFHTMLEKRSQDGKAPIKIFCFYEEIPIIGIGEIVPKHSAILSAYRCQSIHANHMEMARFSGPNDPGYQAVSGELWLWANEVEEQLASKTLQAQPTKNESLPSSDELREKRGKKFATIADVTRREIKRLVNPKALVNHNEAVSRNRLQHILPWAYNRLHLRGLLFSYINASPISVGDADRKEHYIACQGPLDSSHMWRMTWEQEVSVIVMLTLPVEDGVEKCVQYYPESKGDIIDADSFRVALVGKSQEPSSETRNLKVTHDGQERTITHFLFTTWPDHDNPPDADLPALFSIMKLSRDLNTSQKPRIINCSAGVGRTGTFITLEHLMREMDCGVFDCEDISVDADVDGNDAPPKKVWEKGDAAFETVNALREQRMRMVNYTQLAMIYEVLRKKWMEWRIERDYEVERDGRELGERGFATKLTLGAVIWSWFRFS